MDLAQQRSIDALGDGLHRRLEVNLAQFLEGLAPFPVADDEGVVEPLVQRHLHVGGHGVLLHQRGAVLLAANLELAGAAGVDHIAELGDLVLIVPVDHVGHHQVGFQHAQALVRPQLGDEGIQLVFVASRERLAEVQTVHRYSPKFLL